MRIIDTFSRSIAVVLVLTVLLFSGASASNCFEDLTDADWEPARYSTKEIYAVNKNATDIEKIKVWVGTPGCTKWMYRGCTVACVRTGQYCNSWGMILPILHSRCHDTFKFELHYVYDRYDNLDTDAPVNRKMVSCYTLFASMYC